MEILKIHASNITKHGDIDYEAVVKLAENFNGADLRNVCTEAGMFAIRDERDYIVQVRVSRPVDLAGVDQPALFALQTSGWAMTFVHHSIICAQGAHEGLPLGACLARLTG